MFGNNIDVTFTMTKRTTTTAAIATTTIVKENDKDYFILITRTSVSNYVTQKWNCTEKDTHGKMVKKGREKEQKKKIKGQKRKYQTKKWTHEPTIPYFTSLSPALKLNSCIKPILQIKYSYKNRNKKKKRRKGQAEESGTT